MTYSVTTRAIHEGASRDAVRIHNSSYQMVHLPRVGDTFHDSGRGIVKVMEVVYHAHHAGITLMVK